MAERTNTYSFNDSVDGIDNHKEGDRKTSASKRKNYRKKAEKEKSVLGKAGDAIKAAFNAVMAAGTLASLVLAAETIWELHGTPLTFANALPTLTKLLPLTGIGVLGAAQLVGVVARVTRVIVTLPIMVSGTWVILQSVPQVPSFSYCDYFPLQSCDTIIRKISQVGTIVRPGT